MVCSTELWSKGQIHSIPLKLRMAPKLGTTGEACHYKNLQRKSLRLEGTFMIYDTHTKMLALTHTGFSPSVLHCSYLSACLESLNLNSDPDKDLIPISKMKELSLSG